VSLLESGLAFLSTVKPDSRKDTLYRGPARTQTIDCLALLLLLPLFLQQQASNNFP
jgi:hypothetical protein